MIRFIETHRKAIAAFLFSGITEAITVGVLTGKWATLGHLLVVAATTAGVYAAPANEPPR